MPSDLIIDLVRHMKARNRDKWTIDDSERPLSKLGLRQAEFHAAVLAAGSPIDAVYSSPALRCRQTIEPLARRLGLGVRIEPLLAERGHFHVPIGAENPLLELLRFNHESGGRVVVCSHGNTIPAFLDSLQADYDAPLPSILQGFGGWYRVSVGGASIRIERFDPPAGFPTR